MSRNPGLRPPRSLPDSDLPRKIGVQTLLTIYVLIKIFVYHCAIKNIAKGFTTIKPCHKNHKMLNTGINKPL